MSCPLLSSNPQMVFSDHAQIRLYRFGEPANQVLESANVHGTTPLVSMPAAGPSARETAECGTRARDGFVRDRGRDAVRAET